MSDPVSVAISLEFVCYARPTHHVTHIRLNWTPRMYCKIITDVYRRTEVADHEFVPIVSRVNRAISTTHGMHAIEIAKSGTV